MPRTTNSVATRKKQRRVLAEASGYFGNRSRLYRYAIDPVIKAGQYAYRDRRKRKSEFRNLWIARINAACRQQGITYSRFMNGLKKSGVEMDRKQLSELAIHDATAFAVLVEKARLAVGQAPVTSTSAS